MSPRGSTSARPARSGRSSGSESATRARFEKRAADARRGRLRQVLGAVLVVALLAGLVWLVGISSVLGVEAAQVSGEDPADTEPITELVLAERGTPLARVDTDELEERITTEVPGVARADVTREWPNDLKVKVTSRVPAIAVSRTDGKVRLMDLEGVGFRTVSSTPEGVPVVASDDTSSELSAEGVRAALGMLRALPEDLRDRVRDVVVDEADQVSFRLGGTQVVWGDQSSPKVKVEVIEVLLAKKPKVIDVSAAESPVTR